MSAASPTQRFAPLTPDNPGGLGATREMAHAMRQRAEQRAYQPKLAEQPQQQAQTATNPTPQAR